VLTLEEETQGVWSVTFQPNSTYTFQDDYRPALIHVVFRTTATASSSASVSTPSSTSKSSGSVANSDVAGSGLVPLRGTLKGVVRATGKLSLTYGGKTVATLKAGRYAFVVDDQTAKRGFQLQRIAAAPITLTSAAYVGKKLVRVSLKPGQWWFFSSGGAKRSFMVAA
jgi:hypothetical protein